MANELITRDQWRSFMGVKDGATTKYHTIGEGFTNLAESKNPAEYTRKYVHEKTERSDVTGYATSIAYSTDLYSEDPVVSEVVVITDSELRGTDAQREIISVNLWKAVDGSEDTFEATRRMYSVIPAGKGDGTEAMIYTGTFKAAGDIVFGKFNTETKIFTPN